MYLHKFTPWVIYSSLQQITDMLMTALGKKKNTYTNGMFINKFSLS